MVFTVTKNTTTDFSTNNGSYQLLFQNNQAVLEKTNDFITVELELTDRVNNTEKDIDIFLTAPDDTLAVSRTFTYFPGDSTFEGDTYDLTYNFDRNNYPSGTWEIEARTGNFNDDTWDVTLRVNTNFVVSGTLYEGSVSDSFTNSEMGDGPYENTGYIEYNYTHPTEFNPQSLRVHAVNYDYGLEYGVEYEDNQSTYTASTQSSPDGNDNITLDLSNAPTTQDINYTARIYNNPDDVEDFGAIDEIELTAEEVSITFVWDGSQWVTSNVKVWDGSQWINKRPSYFDGNNFTN